MKTYEVLADRDEQYWRVRVPAVDRVTSARHVREIETMARDLIAIMEDVEPDSFEIDMRIELPADVRAHLDAAARLREEATRANAEAAQEARAAARGLVDAGMPLRDAGAVLGVSHQRVAQLVG
ncbi:hypothetical protein ACIRON_02800 [Nocardioides sp. NPDC101246]|uniref:hypothetical protein n=1 Tax=Nocardioides sp. NPDC101246 TaxID=3364336 RepID=UPI0037F85EA0